MINEELLKEDAHDIAQSTRHCYFKRMDHTHLRMPITTPPLLAGKGRLHNKFPTFGY